MRSVTEEGASHAKWLTALNCQLKGVTVLSPFESVAYNLPRAWKPDKDHIESVFIMKANDLSENSRNSQRSTERDL